MFFEIRCHLGNMVYVNEIYTVVHLECSSICFESTYAVKLEYMSKACPISKLVLNYKQVFLKRM
jgi:hypothetical protein